MIFESSLFVFSIAVTLRHVVLCQILISQVQCNISQPNSKLATVQYGKTMKNDSRFNTLLLIYTCES